MAGARASKCSEPHNQIPTNIYKRQEMREKRHLLDFVCSNSTWKDGSPLPLPTANPLIGWLLRMKRTTKKKPPEGYLKTFINYNSMNHLKGKTFRVVFRLLDDKAACRKKPKPGGVPPSNG